MSYQGLTPESLFERCAAGHDRLAWEEFHQRYHKLISATVVAMARRYGRSDPAEWEDLVQDVYVKLCARNGRALRGFVPRGPNAEFGYLKVVAGNVVRDWVDRQRAESRDQGREVPLDSAPEPADRCAAAELERSVLLDEVDRVLRSGSTERDRRIFWLHFRAGLTTERIAGFSCFDLGPKGVQSVVLKGLRLLRGRMVNEGQKGKSAGETFS